MRSDENLCIVEKLFGIIIFQILVIYFQINEKYLKMDIISYVYECYQQYFLKQKKI